MTGSASRGDDDRPGGEDDRPALTGEVEETGRRGDHGTYRVRTRAWTWEDEDVRRGLPWIGVFLVVFGAILLLGQAYPGLHVLGAGLITAIGVALLVSWATHRSWGLYPGLLITAFGLPGLLEELGVLPPAGGYGTFLFGAGLLGVAGLRWRERGTWGWQLYVGGLLAVVGVSEIADRLWPVIPTLGDVLGPLLLVALGTLVLARAVRR